MAVLVTDIVPACDTNEQGSKIRRIVEKELATGHSVELDFYGVTNVTSSFVNSAFIELLPKFDVTTIKTKLMISRVNRQIGNMINRRFASEASKPSA